MSELIARHAPYKRVRLQLDGTALAGHAGAGTMTEIQVSELIGQWPEAVKVQLDGTVVEMEVAREHVAVIAQKALALLPVHDLTVEDPSLEDVIGQAFENGA